MAISDRLLAATRAMPDFVFSQNRAIANAGAAVERDRRASDLRTTDEPVDLESVIKRLSSDVVV